MKPNNEIDRISLIYGSPCPIMILRRELNLIVHDHFYP